MDDSAGRRKPSVPDLGGINPAEAAADILATIQDAAAEEVSTGAAKMVIVTVGAKVGDQADVVREYADVADGLEYPTINAAVRPMPGDQAVAIERPGGMVILGKAWAPGDPDLDTVRAGTDMLTNAVTNRILAPGSVAGDNVQANAIRNSELAANAVDTGNVKDGSITGVKLSANYAAQNHNHPEYAGDNHSHNYASSGHGHGGHNHSYNTYTGATWENAKWTSYNTGSSQV